MAIIPGNTGTTTKAVDGIEGATSGAPVSLPSGFSGPSQRPFSAADADLTMTVATHGGLVSMTPTATRTITLPSTSVYTGYSVEVINLSSAQNININASGGGQVYILSGGQSVKLLSTTAAPTLPGQWAVSTAGSGSGLNEQPVKNYLQAIATAVASAGTLSTVAPNGSVTTSAWFSHVTTPFTMVQDTSTPLRGTASYLSATNTGASSDGSVFFQLPRFQLELADRGKPVSLSLDITGVTAANQWDVVVVRYNNAGAFQELIPVAGTASNASGVAANGLGVPSAQVPSGLATMRGFFVPASDDSYYAVRFRRLSGSTQIEFDTLYVGPQVQLSGAPVTDWQSYTPIGAFTTNSTYTGRHRRVGDSIELQVDIAFAGVPNSTSAVFSFTQLLNGLGLTADTTKFPNTGDVGIPVGTWSSLDSSVANYGGPAIYSGSTNIELWNSASGTPVSTTSPFNFNNGDNLSFTVRIPISQWSSGNTTMAERAVEEYASNDGTGGTAAGASYDTGLQNGSAGSNFVAVASTTAGSDTNYRVRFQTPIQPTDRIEIEILEAGSVWVPIAQSSRGVQTYTPVGNSTYGLGWKYIAGSTTDVYVTFGNQGRVNTNATYAGSGATWSGITAFKWRVRKVSGGAVVGYPVGARNVVGDVTGTAVPSGFIGERVSASLQITANSQSSAGTQYNNITSAGISLTAGVWQIVLFDSINRTSFNAASSSCSAGLRIQNTTDAVTLAQDRFGLYSSNVAGDLESSFQANIYISAVVVLTGTKTIHAQNSNTWNGGSGVTVSNRAEGQFYAVRIA